VRLRKLELHNFRSIESEVLDLGRFCALIGSNNAGKSNLMAAIALLVGEKWPLTSIQDTDFRNLDTSVPITIRGWFDEEFGLPGLDGVSGFCLEGSKTDLRYYPIDRNGDRLRYRPSGREAAISNEMRAKIPGIHVGVDRSASTQLRPTAYTMFGRILRALNEHFREDAERQARFLVKIEEALSELRIEQLDTAEQAIRESLRVQTGLRDLDLAFTLHDPGDFYRTLRPRIADVAGAQKLDPEQMGAGVQSALIIALLEAFQALVRDGAVLLIDEPELFLHPHAARHLCSVLERLADAGTQVILTTHSPYFVNLAHPERVQIVRKTEAGTEVSSTTSLGADQREQARMIVRFDATANEVFFSKVAVVVEGPVDRIAVQHAFALRGVNPDALGITVCIAGDKGKIPLLAKVLKEFEIPTVVMCDRDPGKPTERLNDSIERIVGQANAVLLDPNLDVVCGVQGSLGREKLDTEAALTFFANQYRGFEALPEGIKACVLKAQDEL
jgi:predicted ATP-dependent endonuclease of OLD family